MQKHVNSNGPRERRESISHAVDIVFAQNNETFCISQQI